MKIDEWRRPIAERMRVVAAQVEAGNVSAVIVLSKAGNKWVQDIRYADQYEAVGALEYTKMVLLVGQV